MSIIRVNKILPYTGETITVEGTIQGTVATSSYVDVTGIDNLSTKIPPFIKSVVPDVVSANETQTFVITGSNFDEGAIGYVFDSSNVRRNPTTSTRNSDTKITLVYSGNDIMSTTTDPKDVVVENSTGYTNILVDSLNVNASPLWVTSAGKIGDIYAGSYLTASFYASASDPDNDSLTYSITSGSLPEGLTYITSSGEISGSDIMSIDSASYNQSGVNYNFTSTVTDGVESTSRSFYITKKWIDGSTEALAITDPLQIQGLGIESGTTLYTLPPGAATIFTAKYSGDNFRDTGYGYFLWFSAPDQSTATVNLIDNNYQWNFMLIEKQDDPSVFGTIGFSSNQTFNTRDSTATGTSGTRSGYRVYFGYGGGHGIYTTGQGVCSWSNGAGAIGAGWNGSTCGTFPNGLIMGTGQSNTASYTNRGGTWNYWFRW